MNRLSMTIEDRTTPFSSFCHEFDYHLMEVHWKKFVKLYSHGWSLHEIKNQLEVLSIGQLVKMATAFDSQGETKVKYNAPCCKWDDVHNLLPVELAPRKGPFGVAQLKCEACQRYFTLKHDQFTDYAFTGKIDHYLCIKCTEEWKNALLTSGA